MKKGQAAMEFLMSYGWVLLIVLVSISALAYFGVLNPGRFLPESCTLVPGLECEAFAVYDDGTVMLKIRNGMGQDLTGFTVIVYRSDTNVSWCSEPLKGKDTVLKDSEVDTFIGSECKINQGGQRFKGDIVVTYYASNERLNHTKKGSLYTEVN
jgi:hypothetical protein